MKAKRRQRQTDDSPTPSAVDCVSELVVPFLGAANRDARVFDEPNKFDLDRRNSAQHLSFGGGVHSCLGRQIASLELSWFFTAFLQRFPKPGLAGKPVWKSNLEFRSLKSLPVSLNQGGR